MTLGSLFDGIGGFPLAGSLVGIQPLWASEIDPRCRAVTAARFPDIQQHGDINTLSGRELPPVDIICGGSPCQDLSIAGLRNGLKHTSKGDGETTRSGLFMEQIRIVREMREETDRKYPRLMVWENVPGAYSSNKGGDFRAVLEETAKIAEPAVSIPGAAKWRNAGAIVGDGWSIAWRTLDAQYWGVPQRRKRIFLVADFGSERAGKVLFEPEGLLRHYAAGREAWKAFAAHPDGGVDQCLYPDVYHTLTANNAGNVESAMRANCVVYEYHQQDARVKEAGDIAPTVVAKYGMGGNNTPPVVQADSVNVRDGTLSEDVSGTLLAKESGGQSLTAINPVVIRFSQRRYVVRRLMPLECERLNGYQDGWTDVLYNGRAMADSPRYRMLGNSVAIPCVVYVMAVCRELLEGDGPG